MIFIYFVEAVFDINMVDCIVNQMDLSFLATSGVLPKDLE